VKRAAGARIDFGLMSEIGQIDLGLLSKLPVGGGGLVSVGAGLHFFANFGTNAGTKKSFCFFLFSFDSIILIPIE